ncbi:type I polyketide synthase [Streptomyces tendae]|uniref:type I polyketide synthase n=1 Tax=Streptomyces tendae TaxID=1932 RepID=UPI0037F66D94
MTTPSTNELVDALRNALKENERIRQRLGDVEAQSREPIAIVGMACRYPGDADSPEALWQLVADGTDAVSGYPTDRGWNLGELYDPDPQKVGRTYSRGGGFLRSPDQFDHEFFAIPPREATVMDPHQRLLLETSWEAFERAGISADAVRGSQTGVYVGVSYQDNISLRTVPSAYEGYVLTGNIASVVSGRLSYAFGLQGPAVTVDTACSSSLVALHLAAQALRSQECSLALVGGATIMSGPASLIEFARQRGIAPDGRCKAFGDEADGMGWAEGVGVLVVERLSDARRNGHQVLALVTGSALNQDGASNGLTAPNGAAQRQVIRAALANAGVASTDIDAVEAHGTGTRLGDPIEARALLDTYGRERTADTPLWIGSLKSNIGHSQAAAGVGGVIKMVMAMRHGELPRTLHAQRPTSHVDWSAGTVRLLTDQRQWPDRGRPRRVAVSSFGISGTNAHVVLEQAPDAPAEAPPEQTGRARTGPWPFVVTARGAAALRGQAEELRSFVERHPELEPSDVGRSLVTTRAALADRAVVVAEDRAALLAGLSALAAGTDSPAVHVDRAREGRLAMVFTGQGAQRAGMGRELSARYPVFDSALDEVCAVVDDLLGRSLRELMREDGPLLDRTEFAQPALFAFEVALFRLVQSWGIRPDFVAGHSIGEISAAHVAGVLSLADAGRMVVARGRLMQALPDGGAMVAVNAAPDVVAPLVAAADGVSVAAVNSPDSVVLSGAREPVAEVVAQLAADGYRTRRLTTSHAFHSPLMDPVLDDFRAVVAQLAFGAPDIPVVSTLTGAPADAATLGEPEYWVRQAREQVRFADAVATLHERGVTRFLELGPDAMLSAMVRECLPASRRVTAVAASRRDRPEAVALLDAAGRLFTGGGEVGWAALFPGQGRRVDLPTYAFRRHRHWLPRDGSAVQAPSVPPPAATPEPGTDARVTDVLAVVDQRRVVNDLLRTSVAVVLGLDSPADVDLESTFQDLGFSSLAAVELRDRLNAALDLELAGTVAFDYPTPAALAAYLLRLVTDAADEESGTAVPRAALADDPIVVVGMACRYPGGVGSPEQLWELVDDGRDAVSGLPTDRGWDLDTLLHPDATRQGATHVRGGGFLDDVAQFDARFFGISPREAASMDPQQRLLLELTWEALERAGIDPKSMRGSQTGVFAGTSDQDYADLLRGSAELADGYLLTGTSAAVLAGRLSYQFGLEGPALTVDTACSSSLVAMHLAAQALRSGECALALAGGATVMATPVDLQEFDKQGLSADGRCKAFGADADGTGFAEGAGLLVLERLSDARRNGHSVLAVLRGSAINQDGASNGLTAPNGLAQQRVVRQALANAGVRPDEVDAVDGHGTGTVLGDPIEIKALQGVYGRHRGEGEPLWLGSLKSNIGHSQAAAGVGSVIKMIMAIRHGVLPKTLHVDRPSEHVDWESGTVRLLGDARPWPTTGRPRRAAVSSFGASGTNAHVVVEQAPDPEPEAGPADRPHAPQVLPLLLSGRGEAALRDQAVRLREHLLASGATGPAELADVAFSLAGTRSSLDHRAVVLGADLAGLLSGLDDLVAGTTPVTGPVGSGDTDPVFVFPGQGGQYAGMALRLWDTSPVFAASMEECEAALAPYVDWHGRTLRDLLTGADGADFDHAEQIQPMLFAVMVSLARLWISRGVVPSAIIAHSVGEVAAAHIAGILTLADAARVLTARARVSGRVTGYATLWVGLPAEQVCDRIAQLNGVHVSAINGPRSVVVTGPLDRIAALRAEYEAAGVRARPVPMDYPTHSPDMAVVEDELLALLTGIRPATASVPYYSTTFARRVQGDELDGRYWFTNLVQPVRFHDTAAVLLADGYRVLLEVAPHPLLGPAIEETADERGVGATVLATLRRGESDPDMFLRSMAAAWRAGLTVDWSATFAGTGARRVDLPTYAFQRQRYWPTASASAPGDLSAVGLEQVDHPLLGAKMTLAGDAGLLFTSRLSLHAHPWLVDHALFDRPLLPGTAFLELAIRAADEAGLGGLEELTIEAPLMLPSGHDVLVQVLVGAPDGDGRRTVEVFSQSAEPGEAVGATWTRHARGSAVPGDHPEPAPWPADASWPPAGATELDVAGSYERLAALGYHYGSAFTGLRRAWRTGDQVFAEAELPEPLAADAVRFGLHPALMDTGQHSLAIDRLGSQGAEPDNPGVQAPFLWSGVRLLASGASALRLVFSPTGPSSWSVDGFDTTGRPVLRIDSLVAREVSAEQLRDAGTAHADALFELGWVPCGPAEAGSGAGAEEPIGWVVPSGPTRTAPAEDEHTVGAWLHPDLAALGAAVDGGAPLPELVVLRVPGGRALESTVDSVHTAVNGTLRVLQDWFTDSRWERSRLVVVTDGGLVGAAVGGLVRSAQSENPDRMVLVEQALAGPEPARARPVEALARAAVASGEPEVSVRDGRLWSPRLNRVAAEALPKRAGHVPDEPSSVWGTGTVLLTGASGVLAGLVAEHLVTECGVRRLLLVSRRGPAAPGADELVERLTEAGASVRIVACDLAVRHEVTDLVGSVPPEFPLSAVVHCAGVLDDATVGSLTPDRVDAVLRPKVDGAWHLHEATQDAELSAFVLFSSAASAFGTAGQANYAAANGFCDELAEHRRRLGLPAVSIAWGWWAEASGMGSHLGTQDRARMARTGIRPVDNDFGLTLFDAACRRQGRVIAAPFDLAGLSGAATVPGLLRGLVRRPARRVAELHPADGAGLREGLAALEPAERDQAVAELVRTHAAAVLGHSSSAAVDDRQPFTALGFDSLTAVELRNRLNTATGLRLPATLIFDYPSPAALIEFVRGEIGGETAAPARPAVSTAEAGSGDDPIAIVGMACRFPGGVGSPDELWDLVAEGRDVIGAFPTDRGWNLADLYHPDPDHPGTTYTREGGFLHDADQFDPEFFGISPREAITIDPQQRLLLETAWESLENAGIDPTSLRGGPTGVFVGLMYHDYGSRLHTKPEELEGYLGNGSAGSIASGRVAYEFGFEGPAVTVDTACSSSLVSMHLAAQTLRSGECSLALAGGVTVMATPDLFVEYSRLRANAADGRCRAYGADADGTGWSEGAGLVVLERLSDARRNGHQVLALLAGSALNQDGASNGLTAPNGPSQQRVIRQALAGAGLSASDVDVVEGHGTGTRLGDPIEAQALLATYGREHAEDAPLWLGSIKSNIGHTQAAAGIAGTIKMIMAMRHGIMPRTLFADTPSPQVDWSSGAIALLERAREWPDRGRPRRAGVSSFGVSGTNAHIILEEPPAEFTAPAPFTAAGLPVWPLVLTARGPEALRHQAERLESSLRDRPDAALADIAYSLVAERAGHDHRAVLLASDRAQALERLAEYAHGDDGTGTVADVARRGPLAMVFTGQGAQHPGMGAELHRQFPVFAAAFDQVCDQLDPAVREAVLGDGENRLDATEVAQPALFAVEVALFRLFESWGVRPDFLTGHSVGEIAAAHVAGVLSLPDACRLVSERGRLMARLDPGGVMVSVTAGEQVVAPLVAQYAESVSIAAVNTPGSVVLSGLEPAVTEIVRRLTESGHRTKQLVVSHAFHSPLMAPMLDEFRALVHGLAFQPPRIPMAGGDEVTDPEYWVRHVRDTVRFADTVSELHGAGITRFLEIGPDAPLTGAIRECLVEPDVVAVPSMRRHRDEAGTALTALGTLFAAGVEVDWPALFDGTGARHTPLPTYPFQHQRYWLDIPEPAADLAAVGLDPLDHPLLLAGVEVAGGEAVLLTGRLAPRTQPWLAEHVLFEQALLPGTAFVDVALRAAEQVGCAVLDELTIESPLLITAAGSIALQILVEGADEEGHRKITISARPDGDADDTAWTRHATGTVSGTGSTPEPDPLTEWPPRGADVVDVAGAYDLFAEAGHDYGPTFQGLVACWRRGAELYAEVALPPGGADAERYGVHPALLDAGLHGGVLRALTSDTPQGLVPFSWTGARLYASGATALRIRVRPVSTDTVALDAFDDAGAPVFSVAALSSRSVSADRLRAAASRDDSLFEISRVECGRVDDIAPRSEVTVLDGPHQLAELVSGREKAAEVPALVAMSVPGEGPAVTADVHAAVNSVLRSVQTWLADPAWQSSRLVVVTNDSLTGATVRGLLRSAQSENPDRIVLVEGGADAATAAALHAAVESGEPEVSVRDGVLRAPRLARPAPADTAQATSWSAGTVLITGASGALAGHVARYLVTDHHVRHVLLTSRQGDDSARTVRLAAELAELGAAVRVVACDVADGEQVAALVQSVEPEFPLTAVLHCAGVLDDGVFDSLTTDRVDAVLAPKVDGAWNLHQLTRELDLSAFVLFSSSATAFGAPGQANYAAANAFLDALAVERHRQGLPAVSISWGWWGAGSGMTENLSETDVARMGRGGMLPMTTAQGLESLATAVDMGRPNVMAARLDLSAVRSAGTVPALLRGLVRRPARRAATASAARLEAARLAGSPVADQVKAVGELVREQIAAVLGHPSGASVDMTRAFHEVGFDSLTAVELRNRLNTATGLRLPATLVFDHPTPEALAAFVRSELVGDEADTTDVTPAGPATAAGDDPIVIVGMACRYPGEANSPDELWRLVAEGREGITGFPVDRGWDLPGLYDPDPDRVGTTYARAGGFLDRLAEFDSDFFGISPREAIAIDPQQRLLLETAWESFENAGIVPSALRGGPVGVFVGANGSDYPALLARDSGDFGGRVLTGNAASIISGRLSYEFGFEGPSVSIDTACSSSLVAMHLAAQALRSGECSLALAGGVATMATPNMFVEMARQRGLSPDGRCRAFGAGADGTGWAEGVGLLVLERLSEARRNDHRVLAVLAGSAVNQDGASNGLTAPSGPSQQRVIRAALANAGLSASEVDVVEGHGTGTRLGDPIEAQALLATYGHARESDTPLWLGSIKSNIGHSQAAAGAAGTIKMIMAMRHGLLPRTLHAETPSPEVDWSSGGVALLDRARDWAEQGRPRRAGVSAFSLSGTNAHIILEEPPEDLPTPPTAPVPDEGPANRRMQPVVLSARGPAALHAQAARLHAHLTDRPELTPADVARSLVTDRAVHDHRAVVLAADREQLCERLAAFADGTAAPGAEATGVAGSGGLAVVFTGQGSQRGGMGRELHRDHAVFAAAFDEVCAALDPALRDMVFDEDDARLNTTEFAQPALFAIEVALFRLFESWGVRPDFVTGHSVGEISAAHVSGVLSLTDACALVTARARLMQGLAPGGTMMSVDAGEDVVAPLVAAQGAEVSIAAVNTPQSVVVSGTEPAVGELGQRLRDAGHRTKQLAVSHAFHSPLMDPVLAEFRAALDGLGFKPPRIPMTGSDVATPEYWVQHVRNAVRFADTVSGLRDDGVTRFLELGPDATLTGLVRACVPGGDVVAVPGLRRGRPETESVLAALGALFAAGVQVDWPALFPAAGAGRTPLPTYAFQHTRYWPDTPETPGTTTAGPDAVDSRFWNLVEQGDLDALSAELDTEERDGLGAVLPALTRWRIDRREKTVVDSWRYRLGWRPVPTRTEATLTGTWLLVVPAGHRDGAWAAPIEAAMTAAGAAVRVLAVGEHQLDRAALAARLGEPPLAGVVSLLALEQSRVPGHPGVPVGLAATVSLVQALEDREIDAPLWCLTRGAVNVVPGDGLDHPDQALLWGFGRTLALERPDRWGGLVDLPVTLDEASAAGLIRLLGDGGTGEQAALRDGAVLGSRLVRADPDQPPRRNWRPSGSVLVTGGLTGLGARTARWLAEQGAPHLVLTSRRGREAPGAVELEADLTALGAAVTIAACDVADRGEVKALLANLPHDLPLTAVFHSAGVANDGVVTELTLDRLNNVLRPKVEGAWNLHELTKDLDLSAFVLFSSAAGLIGSPGQSHYAAGNAFLNALAHHRRARGLPATTIGWGLLAGGGMADDTGATDRASRRGLHPMDPGQSLAGLRRALDHDETYIAMTHVDWTRFIKATAGTAKCTVISDLPEYRAAFPVAAAGDRLAQPNGRSRARARLDALNGDERDAALMELVQEQVAEALGHSSAEVLSPTKALVDLGFDSLAAVELRNRLVAVTGLTLPATLTYDHPTLLALRDHLRTEMFGADADQAESALAELDRLEEVLSAVTADEGIDETAKNEVLRRVQKMAAALADRGGQSEEGRLIANADDNELFDFINRELGGPGQ